jgi:hypothetical protein
MKDKNKKSEVSGRSEHERKRAERRTRRSGTPVEKLEVDEVNYLSASFLDEVFPLRVKDACTILAFKHNGVTLCYFCMDSIGFQATSVHSYFLPEHRSRENILICKDIFHACVQPWCDKNGFKMIFTGCDGDDKAVVSIIETFGFTTQRIVTGSMPVIKGG